MSDTIQRKFIVLPSSGGATVVPPSNVLWVSAGGVDLTGTRGDAALPYLTFQAALTDAQTGDQIRVGPGSFALPVAGLVWPPALTRLSIVGSGVGAKAGTQLVQASNAALDVPAYFSALHISDIEIATTTSGVAILADGSGVGAIAGTFMGSGGLVLHNVRLDAASGFYGLVATSACEVSMTNVHSLGPLAFLSCNFGPMQNILAGDYVSGGKTMLLDWEVASVTAPAAGRSMCMLQSVIAGDLFLGGQTLFSGDSACQFDSIQNYVTNPLLTGGGGELPSVSFSGSATSVDFTTTPLGVSAPMTLSFKGATVVTFAATATFVQNIYATGMNVVTSVIIGNLVSFYDRLANASSKYTTVGTGTITPGYWAGEALASNAETLFFFVASTAPVSAQATGQSAASGAVAVTAVTATGVTVDDPAHDSAKTYVAVFWG